MERREKEVFSPIEFKTYDSDQIKDKVIFERRVFKISWQGQTLFSTSIVLKLQPSPSHDLALIDVSFPAGPLVHFSDYYFIIEFESWKSMANGPWDIWDIGLSTLFFWLNGPQLSSLFQDSMQLCACLPCGRYSRIPIAQRCIVSAEGLEPINFPQPNNGSHFL